MPWPTATDYMEAIQHPKTCFKDQDLQDGEPALDRLGMPFVSSGQFAYVFKLKHPAGKSSAIRCFRGFMGDRERRYKAIDRHLDSVVMAALASFEYDAQGILVGPTRYPILVMEWIDGPTVDVYLEAALQDRAAILHVADQWIKVVKSLRTAQVAHGDLQHGNIIVQNGTLRLVDLDGMFVPSMSLANSSEIGHRHYQHPLRDQFFFNNDLDNFSALVIYISLISLAERPDLWKRFHDENLVFTRPDFLSPSSSPAFAEIKRIGGEHKRLAEILEKACNSGPSMTPALPDLVAAKSKLPSWMVEPAGVVIPTKTREVIPGQAPSGVAPSNTVSSPAGTPAWWQSQRPATGLSQQVRQTVPQTQGAPSTPLQATQIDWKRVGINTVSKTLKFGLTGLLLVGAWFPLLNGVYGDLGFQAISGALTICTYILGSLAFGFSMALWSQRRSTSPRAPSPSYSPARTQYHRTSHWSRPGRWSISPHSTPLPSGSVVGSRARLIYHRPSCEVARKIPARNRVSFASEAAAQSAGYRRCGVCLP
jgi:hypothetical protein